MSSRRDRDDLLAGAWPAATPPSREDIRDELDDHLACGAAELAAAGLDPQQAEERARAAFGDVKAVTRQLYWLHHGRRIMAQLIVLGGLAGVCAVLALVMIIVYRQSAATAGAVANLQAAVGQTSPVDVPVRILVTTADGTPLAGREVYVWPRRIDDPPFMLPNAESPKWNSPRNLESRVEVTLPTGYEQLATDASGAANLGRRPGGVYTAAIDLEPELAALSRWTDKHILQQARRTRDEGMVLPNVWSGYAQRTFDVRIGHDPVNLMLQLPALSRRMVRMVPPSNGRVSGIWMRTWDGGWSRHGAGTPPGETYLWLAIRSQTGGVTTWMRGFQREGQIARGPERFELPMPPDATLWIGYLVSHQGNRGLPVAIQVPVPPAQAGVPEDADVPDIELEAPPPPASQP